MRISLEQNSSADRQTAPYFARIEIATMSIDLETVFRIPIYLKSVNGHNLYVANLCGFEVDADTPEAALTLIERLLPGLLNFGRLPTYVFIARRSYKMYPVYTHRNEVFATTPGGPVFKHVELAKVREYLTDYLHEIGALGVPGRSEKLHVRGVRRSTLSLTRPLFYLKKRPQARDEHEFWAPVFATDDGRTIYTYAASGRREVEVDHGHEVFRLRTQVAQALIADRRLKQDYDLRADRLLPDYWLKVKPNLEEQSPKLAYNGAKFEMYQAGRTVLAVEYRAQEDRYSFYIGNNVDDLRDRAARDLLRRGLIKDTSAVHII